VIPEEKMAPPANFVTPRLNSAEITDHGGARQHRDATVTAMNCGLSRCCPAVITIERDFRRCSAASES
jgi:hypothetical protein